jgi:hypothetical protein
MKLTVTRSGGFAGIPEQVGSVDTAALAPALATEGEGLVRASRFFELPAQVSGGPGADLYRYEITIVDGARTHTVAFLDDERGAAGPLARLVEWVRRALPG